MARDLFRRLMKERRAYKRGSLDHTWRTKAARKYLLMVRNVPVNDW